MRLRKCKVRMGRLLGLRFLLHRNRVTAACIEELVALASACGAHKGSRRERPCAFAFHSFGWKEIGLRHLTQYNFVDDDHSSVSRNLIRSEFPDSQMVPSWSRGRMLSRFLTALYVFLAPPPAAFLPPSENLADFLLRRTPHERGAAPTTNAFLNTVAHVQPSSAQSQEKRSFTDALCRAGMPGRAATIVMHSTFHAPERSVVRS